MATFGPAYGGNGNLGTLFLRMTADPSNLIRQVALAETFVRRGSTSMVGSFVRLGAVVASAMAGAVAAMVVPFSRFQDSFAEVRKSVDATEEGFARLERQFRNMSKEIPANVNEINRVAGMAGQLGVMSEDIASFTRVMMDMGIATNMTADQAATAMARFSNIMDIPHSKMEQLGSAIVELGRNGASTESEIMDMALRLAGAGKEIGLTESQVLGLANALSSVGIRAELGGSAVSQTMQRMYEAVNEGGEVLEGFASIAGVSSREFTKAIATDPAEALTIFFAGLQRLTSEGKNVYDFFEKVNIDSIRMKDVMLRAKNAADLLRKSFDDGSRAFQENSALADEARERYGTFSSQIIITMNIVKDAAISIGKAMVPWLTKVNSWFREIVRTGDDFDQKMKERVDSIISSMIRLWENITPIGSALSGVWKEVLKSFDDVSGVKSTLSTFLGWLKDNFAPLAITAIGMVGDAIYGWRLLFKSTQVYMATMAGVVLTLWQKLANGVASILEWIVNKTIEGVNLATSYLNRILPEWAQMGQIDFKLSLPTDELDIWAQAARETAAEYQQELDNLTNEGKYSDRLLEQYSNFSNRIQQENKKIEESSKQVAKAQTDQAKATEAVANALSKEQQFQLNQATSFIEKAYEENFPGYDKSKKRGRYYRGLMPPGLTEFEDMEIRQGMQIATEMEKAQNDPNITRLKEIQAQELSLTEEHQKKMEELLEAHANKVRQLQEARAMFVLGTTSKMFEDMASIAETWGGEQNAIYKGLFAASKAFAIAEAIVKIHQGIAAAAALPWPANLAAMASVVAATASIVSNIRSVQLNFAGERARGGPVDPGKVYLVGERGPELFSPKTPGTIVPNTETTRFLSSMERFGTENNYFKTSSSNSVIDRTQSNSVIDRTTQKQELDRMSELEKTILVLREKQTQSLLTLLPDREFIQVEARETGGPALPGKTYLVGERGPELFSPAQSNSVASSESRGGRDPVKVIVNNYTDVQPEVTERQEGNEKVIEVLIRRVKKEIGSEIRDGRGDVSRAMETSFNLRRGR